MKQNSSKRRRPKGCLIAFLVFLVLIAVVWFIGIPFANKKATSYVESMLIEVLESPEIPKLTYSNIRVDAVRGQIAFEGLRLPVEDTIDIKADELMITVAPTDLINYGIGRSSALPKATIAVRELIIEQPEVLLSAKSLEVDVKGKIDLNDLNSLQIEALQLTTEHLSYLDRSNAISIAVVSLRSEITGTISSTTLDEDYWGIIKDLKTVSIQVKDGSLVPQARLVEDLMLLAGPVSWINDPKNLTFKELDVYASTNDTSLVIDNFALDAMLFEFSGNATLPKTADNKSFEMKLDVAKLDNRIRNGFPPLLLVLGQPLPDEAFSIDVNWDGESYPRIRVR